MHIDAEHAAQIKALADFIIEDGELFDIGAMLLQQAVIAATWPRALAASSVRAKRGVACELASCIGFDLRAGALHLQL